MCAAGAQRHHEQVFGLQGWAQPWPRWRRLRCCALCCPTTPPRPARCSARDNCCLWPWSVSCCMASFVLVQTVRHRDYFYRPQALKRGLARIAPSRATAQVSGALMLASLSAVVLLGRRFRLRLRRWCSAWVRPGLIGVIIAMVVLLPENPGRAAAARVNRLQTSMNLALGSALARRG